MKSADPKYRFPGLNSFTVDDKEIFKGRDKESADLYAKILLYKTVVLHADSGTGKSSLIQAGLLPRLKESEENYFPVTLQFNEIVQSDADNLLIDFTLKKIQFNIEDRKVNTTSNALLDAQPKSFWEYSKILEEAGKKLLLIFDQFENLQTFKRKQVDLFVEELYNLINPKIPADIFKNIEIQLSTLVDEKSDAFNQVNQSYLFLSKPSVANLLFVIREDKLGVMSLLSDYFPDILKNDFRIEPLSIKYAKEALEIPAAYKESEFASVPFKFEDPGDLINKIADEDTGQVDPVLLQIVARSIEINQVIGKGKVSISNKDIPEVSNIIIKYYNDGLDKIREDLNLTEFQIAEYKKSILNKFVINDRRTIVDSESIETNDIEFIKELVKAGLIREIPAEKKAIYYQLVHDRMIAPIVNDPKIIKANYFEKYLKSIKVANKVAIISIVTLLLSWIFVESYYSNYSAHLNKLDFKLDSLHNELSASQNKYKKSPDSILVIYSQTGINNISSNDSVKFEQKIKANLDKVKILAKKQANYYNTIDERNAWVNSLAPSLKKVITLLIILFWGLLLFFQFARRISLKYLFKEIHIYKTKKISKYHCIKIFFPFWLAPVSKTNYIQLSSVKPVSIFNKTFRPDFLNFILVLSLLIIILIQFHLTYLSYDLIDKKSDQNFYLNLLFSLFSIVAAFIWFSPLNNKEYNNEKENSKIISRKDFITLSIYATLAIALFKLRPISSEIVKSKYTGKKNPRFRVKSLKPKFDLLDNKSQIVINKKSKIIHYIDDNGFSVALKSIQYPQDFLSFKHHIERFNQLDELTIKGKPSISIKYLSWNTENIALECLKSGNIEMAAKILMYGIRQNYKSNLRLTDLLVLICIRHNTKVPNDTLDQLINYSANLKNKKLIARVEKWKSQSWRNKILNRPKVMFNKTEI
jgi:hypothetical protein